jgi:hypothetical protein
MQPIERIVIEFIPQEQQRYDTCGDYQIADGELLIRITKVEPEVYSHAILVHELVEVLLCRQAGITPEDVDAFDIHGIGSDLAEPGNDVRAPYHRQHLWSDVAERLFIAAAGLSWSEYDGVVSDTGA